MNKREKEVMQSQLDQEKAVLKKLEKQYQTALNDIINKTKILQADIDMLQAAGEADDKTLSMVRSKVYQKQYQKALKQQIIADNTYRNHRDYNLQHIRLLVSKCATKQTLEQFPNLAPQNYYCAEHCRCVKRKAECKIALRVEICAQQLICKLQMTAARHGQKLCKSLNYTQNNRL